MSDEPYFSYDMGRSPHIWTYVSYATYVLMSRGKRRKIAIVSLLQKSDEPETQGLTMSNLMHSKQIIVQKIPSHYSSPCHCYGNFNIALSK